MWVEADDLHRPLPVEDRDREPMTDAEQLVVCGRLVSGQEKDTNADSEASDG